MNQKGAFWMQSYEDMLVGAARMYYEQRLTQAEIGRQLNTSRSSVSRLLQEARERGVVRIFINYPWKRDYELEQNLLHTFNLKDVRVLQTSDATADPLEGIGALAAEYLDGFIIDGMVLGVSYGRSVAATISRVSPIRRDITVVQILGALGAGNPLVEGPDLVRELANTYGAEYFYLFTHLIVEDPRTRDLLIQEPRVREVLEMGRRSDAVLVGIGGHTSAASSLIWTGYLDESELVAIKRIGSVGHLCAQFFDIAGNLIDTELHHRVISIGIQALKNVETVIGVAGTEDKAEAIFGALKGQYINVLITDDQAAHKIIEIIKTM